MKQLYDENFDYKRIGGSANHSIKGEQRYRSPFWRDRARVIHSPSFRRLRGKTQLFPTANSDFFRDRLVHSMEVANVANTIARKLNCELEDKYGKEDSQKCKIDLDLVELAGLAHDIGHPPFGHQGEEILNEWMIKDGGFEGNAQTLRILALTEKKHYDVEEIEKEGIDDYCGVSKSGIDHRYGLNLTVRSLASILKYDKALGGKDEYGTIPIEKGYYKEEIPVVKELRKKITRNIDYKGRIKTIECQIMDIADDIAYSTYDLEDAFKGGFLHPLLIYSQLNGDFANEIIERVDKALKKREISYSCTKKDIFSTLKEFITLPDISQFQFQLEKVTSMIENDVAPFLLNGSLNMSQISYLRNKFPSKAISTFVSKIDIEYNENNPPLSKLLFDDHLIVQLEILKNITFLSQIKSSRLKVVENRGQKIILELISILTGDRNQNGELFPTDIRKIFLKIKGDSGKENRLICDFIASMTNRYAAEYLERLTGTITTRSIFSYQS